MNNIRIREFNPNKSKRNYILLQKIEKGSLAVRLRNVEFQLSRLNELYKLNLQLTEPSVIDEASRLGSNLVGISNDLRLMLIDYMRWILYHLKIFHLKGLVKFEWDKPPSRTMEFQSRLTNIQNSIRNLLELDPDIVWSPNNRAGRFCEHVETDNHMFNLGTILKEAIENHDVINSGQSSIFSRSEIETLIRSKKPNFCSGALINYLYEFFRDEQCSLSIDITDAIYKSTTQIFYDVYDSPGCTQLRTLVLLLNSASIRCDYMQMEKIFYAIVKIWEILGIDQIEATELLTGSDNCESSQKSIIIQTWINIWAPFLQNNHIFPFATGSFVLSNFSLPLLYRLNNHEALLIKLSKIPLDHVSALVAITDEMSHQFKYRIVQNYVKTALSAKSNGTPFESSAHFEKENNANQGLVDMFLKYTKHKFNTKFNLKEPVELDKLLIKVSQPKHILNNKIISILLTVTVYNFQAHLIYPSVFTHPAPTKLTPKGLRLLLSTSLSFNSLMSIIIYACFQKKIASLRVEDPDDMLLLPELADYLEENHKPDFDEEIKEKCFYILRHHHLGHFLIIFCSFLNVLCSPNFSDLSFSYPTLPQLIRFNLQKIVKTLSIIKSFKRVDERMDIDMVVLSLKTNVQKFPISNNLIIDWSTLF